MSQITDKEIGGLFLMACMLVGLAYLSFREANRPQSDFLDQGYGRILGVLYSLCAIGGFLLVAVLIIFY